VYAISGMGFVYTAQGRIAVFRKSLVSFLYKLALRTDGSQIIFQNNYDLEMLSRIKFLPESSVSMIKGSGVDLTRFRPNPSYKVKKPKVVMAARLLKDKGVIEFVEAARVLSAEMEAAAEFLLVGEVDLSNPASLQKEEVEQLKKESFIKCMGHREDMENILQEAAIFVLPSYREGLPKVVLEASACGKPVITTDVPGCRDAITPAVTGLLVPPRDVGSLALSIKYLLQNESKREEFGIAGRKQAVREFDLELVIQKHLEIYALLARDAQ
jgi:glycosyltransferase involved in cell wall biosynthesis